MGTWQAYPASDRTWHVLTPGGTRACAPASSEHESVTAALTLMTYEGGDLLVTGRYRIPPGLARTG